MTSVILFVFGAIIGSFLNVLGLRWNSGLSLGGRSACAHCGKTLKWWELVPILSFFFLQGRCSLCHVRISWQYPVVEIWTSLLFATLSPIFLPIFCLYTVITIYDFRHKIIPDSLVYSAIVLAFLTAFFTQHTLIDWFSGPILFTFLGLIWFLSRGRAMGFGDAKLSLSIGLLLGAATGFSAVILSFWIGALVGLFLVVRSRVYPLLRRSKRITMNSEVPFAPFLVLGAWLAVVLHLDLLHVSLFF